MSSLPRSFRARQVHYLERSSQPSAKRRSSPRFPKCSLTDKYLKDLPVLLQTESGEVYDAKALDAYFAKGNVCDPNTREHLPYPRGFTFYPEWLSQIGVKRQQRRDWTQTYCPYFGTSRDDSRLAEVTAEARRGFGYPAWTTYVAARKQFAGTLQSSGMRHHYLNNTDEIDALYEIPIRPPGTGSHWDHMDMRNLSFTDINFKGQTFRGTYLSGATFTRCYFNNSSFVGAHFGNAEFVECHFSGNHLLFYGSVCGHGMVFNRCTINRYGTTESSREKQQFKLRGLDCDSVSFLKN